jgi:S-methylmethionine-dependent homocysteine/selenocysteine methylase
MRDTGAMVEQHAQVTVLDGGMGRELMRIGAPFRQPEWSALALMEGTDWVVQAHDNFIQAGAQVITTNSYALVPFHIGEERFAARGHELADLSGRLARQAAEAAPHDVTVAGSLPPLFGSYRPDLFDATRADDLIDPLVDALAPHIDVWLGETLGSIVEARTVRAALDRAGSTTPLWISFTLDDFVPGTLKSGESIDEAVRVAADIGAAAVMFNCCQAETITNGVQITRAALPDSIRVGGYANRFVAAHSSDTKANEGIATFRDDLAPDEYADFVHRWLDTGATMIGGCCGMEPAHIARIAQLV